MKTTRGIAAIAFVAFLAASGDALAEPPADPAPTETMKSTDKAAISKACSQQADAQGLKGKARKHFRSHCKKNGGKAE